ncbi:GNAT family N-acetyltransferase [Falsirhodobacter deserti]|uniref:GNAT family N-acetyltransferase n=1 Tax=Falsirhodobacter deserti TaxID=1365611 RepID=UPI000FE425A3|nr:GNAT family N-acetyltransferase [Falsirhodobacter deserti]
MDEQAEVTIAYGLPATQRKAAARLYWQAFGGKLGRVLGPDRRALEFIAGAIRSDHAIVAMQGGRLLGICGFKTARGAFVAAEPGQMRDSYGAVGAAWRRYALGLLVQDTDNERFLIDGLCVDEGARDRGIGSALVEAICDHARNRGYAAVRLDVVDTNLAARRLYERLGFRAVKLHPLRTAAPLFGFRATVTMVREV